MADSEFRAIFSYLVAVSSMVIRSRVDERIRGGREERAISTSPILKRFLIRVYISRKVKEFPDNRTTLSLPFDDLETAEQIKFPRNNRGGGGEKRTERRETKSHHYQSSQFGGMRARARAQSSNVEGRWD